MLNLYNNVIDHVKKLYNALKSSIKGNIKYMCSSSLIIQTLKGLFT